MYRYTYHDNDYTTGALIILGIIILILIVLCSIPSGIITDYDNITVTKTEIANDGDYMIFGTDSTGQIKSFTLNDSVWHWKWNTADTYAMIEEGQTYNFHCSGVRIPLFSMFPNILEVELVK